MTNNNKNNNIEDDWEAFCNDNYENKDQMMMMEELDDSYDIRPTKNEIRPTTSGIVSGIVSMPTTSGIVSMPTSSGIVSMPTSSGIVSGIACTELYISTQTKISYLNMPIVLNDVFWKIPILPYHMPSNGVVKKQMKFNSNTQEEVDDILNKSKDYTFVNQHIINQIIKPDGRIKFKDVRKVSVGLCKKDITSSRCKKKSAFYNCFVVILRILHNDALNNSVYKEVHVKVFNTGKLEIPGIQNKEILQKVLNLLVEVLEPIVAITSPIPDFRLDFIAHKSETVLINSNFSCGYFINREKMYDLLKYKYKINSAYDPCSYPGIQCEFYYNNKTSELFHQSGMQKSCLNNECTKVSFMIFRTGSVLIVGKCSELILYKIYDFICDMLVNEYENVKENQLVVLNNSKTKGGLLYEEHSIKINKKGRKIITKNN